MDPEQLLDLIQFSPKTQSVQRQLELLGDVATDAGTGLNSTTRTAADVEKQRPGEFCHTHSEIRNSRGGKCLELSRANH